jgi:hypothetical protein
LVVSASLSTLTPSNDWSRERAANWPRRNSIEVATTPHAAHGSQTAARPSGRRSCFGQAARKRGRGRRAVWPGLTASSGGLGCAWSE